MPAVIFPKTTPANQALMRLEDYLRECSPIQGRALCFFLKILPEPRIRARIGVLTYLSSEQLSDVLTLTEGIAGRFKGTVQISEVLAMADNYLTAHEN